MQFIIHLTRQDVGMVVRFQNDSFSHFLWSKILFCCLFHIHIMLLLKAGQFHFLLISLQFWLELHSLITSKGEIGKLVFGNTYNTSALDRASWEHVVRGDWRGAPAPHFDLASQKWNHPPFWGYHRQKFAWHWPKPHWWNKQSSHRSNWSFGWSVKNQIW